MYVPTYIYVCVCICICICIYILSEVTILVREMSFSRQRALTPWLEYQRVRLLLGRHIGALAAVLFAHLTEDRSLL